MKLYRIDYWYTMGGWWISTDVMVTAVSVHQAIKAYRARFGGCSGLRAVEVLA